jgi:hypothetical protein
MNVTSIETCPNLALLGVKMAPIEMTSIESTPQLHEKTSIATGLITGIGSIVAAAFVLSTLHFTRKFILIHQFSPMNFPRGSQGEFLRDGIIKIIWNAGPWELFTSPLPQQTYLLLTSPLVRDRVICPRQLIVIGS